MPPVGAASARLVSCVLKDMDAWWIPTTLIGRRASCLDVFYSLFWVCVLLKEVRQRWISEDGIKFSLPSPRSGGASSVVGGDGGRVEICL